MPDQRPATSDQRPATSDQRPTDDAGQAPPDLTSQVLRIANPKAPRRPRARAARTLIPSDWKPTDATVAEYRAQGVDAMACVREFRNYWLGEGELKANWEATFCNRVDTLIEQGRAPRWEPKSKIRPRGDAFAPAEPITTAPLVGPVPDLPDDLFAGIGNVAGGKAGGS
jgi:DnaT-like ssDNA binding protein